jgi:hypothetical protein
MNGDGIKARRHAREIVYDMDWRGITVPPLYARMGGEFQDLVHSGEYAAWVAANQNPPRSADGHHWVPSPSSRSRAGPGASVRLATPSRRGLAV